MLTSVVITSLCSCAEVFRKDQDCFTANNIAACLIKVPQGPYLGKCYCRDALNDDPLCGNVTSQLRSFCLNPSALSVAVGTEDGRIGRRVK